MRPTGPAAGTGEVEEQIVQGLHERFQLVGVSR
jgi:hypothetical protein